MMTTTDDDDDGWMIDGWMTDGWMMMTKMVRVKESFSYPVFGLLRANCLLRDA